MKAQLLTALVWILSVMTAGLLWRVKGKAAQIAHLGGLVDGLTKTSNALEERLIAALNRTGETRVLLTVDWTEDNVLALRKFFAEETGRKLVELCGGHALAEAMREAQGDRATPRAAGMDELLRFQFNLASDEQLNRISRSAGAQAENSTDGELNDADSAARRSF